MTLQVLHAFAPDLPMMGFGEISDPSVVSTTRRLLADGVARAHAVDPGLEVTTASRDGYASQALVDASRTAALVAVGAMGHGVLEPRERRRGRHAGRHPRPLPRARRGPRDDRPVAPDGRVVVGVDGSKPSLRASRRRSTRRCSPRPRSTSCTPGRPTAPPTPRSRPTRAGAPTGPTSRASSRWPSREAGPAPRRSRSTTRSSGGPVRALVDRSEGARCWSSAAGVGWLRGACTWGRRRCSSWVAMPGALILFSR